MAESTKLRLVRCPKCENLLEELRDFSVYQCGGCGAVLRAKNREGEADSASVKTEEEGIEDPVAKSAYSLKNGVVDLGEASDTDVQSNAGSSRHEVGIPETASHLKTGKWVVENDPATIVNSNVLENSLMEGDDRASGPISSKRAEKRIESEGFRTKANPRTDIRSGRLSISEHPDEGTSTYCSDFSNNYRKTVTNGKDHSGELNRAEILRKLDELKEQLTRSANVVDQPEDKIPSSLLQTDRPPMPFSSFGKHVAAGSSCYYQYPETFPYSNGNEIPRHGVMYPTAHSSSQIPGCGDPFGFQMHRRAPQMPRPCYSGQYANTNHELFEPYLKDGILHHSSCSCFHCYGKNRNQRFTDASYNPALYPRDDFAPFGTHIPQHRAFNPPSLSSRGSQAQRTRWQSEISGHDMNGFPRDRVAKVVVGNGVNRARPLAGGAPFLTCLNCFEVLQLPDKANPAVKRRQKLRCGACSSVLDLSIIDKKLVLSVNAKAMPASTREMDGRIHQVVSNFSSDDYGNSGYEFHSMDREADEVSSGRRLVSNKPQEMLNFLSSSSSVSSDENSSDSLPAKPTLLSSPLHDHFPSSSTKHALQNRFGTGNLSARSEPDMVTLNKVTARQNSLKKASMATEMDVSYNEYSNTAAAPLDSGVNMREDDRLKSKKSGESFFANIVKKSFKDLTKSSQNVERGKSNVTVNGHLISERLVKKAEKQAGPIQPGNYWYDYRAGFWGVMGGPCLGIVPPFIEELNCPMPENCAGGNTGVFVNGRELHEKDLDLLASRGLPASVDGSYTLDISGRVFDEDTGEELDSLGKLAPTVEKMKRGFGMKPPRAAA